jgi:16S rRNA (cytidine1402-2'-O)-methyltransferase
LTAGTLFIVATPIGNLDDLSPRVRQVLAEVDLVAAEDTRVTRRLLSHFGISTPSTALHEHNEDRQAAKLIERLGSGESVAIVSDAGTPLISDPGYRVAKQAHEAGIVVSPVPGPSAVIAALSASGLPTDRFVFEGFLPGKKSARQSRLEDLRDETRTLVFLESVHRVVATLEHLATVFGADRPAFMGRELTKLHEQCVMAPLAALTERLQAGDIPQKGEFVIVVGGAAVPSAASENVDVDALLRELVAVLPGKQAVDIVARLSDMNRNALYARMLALKAEKSGSGSVK